MAPRGWSSKKVLARDLERPESMGGFQRQRALELWWRPPDPEGPRPNPDWVSDDTFSEPLSVGDRSYTAASCSLGADEDTRAQLNRVSFDL
jgi:hypothetical protein